MKNPKIKYITTTLPYVNGSPHMGHTIEFIQADILARTYRLVGYEVFFNTGVDEHGQKIAQKADESGLSRQAYVDKFAAEFKKLKEVLDLSYDSFIRTTDTKHLLAAKEMWQLCSKNGDIYKKKYKGLYCVGCEAFKTESDLVDGKCPEHQKAPEELEEENYFFRLSKYQDYLITYLKNQKSVLPEWRRLELLKFVEEGLNDLSISREKKRMDWGVPVPEDDEHVMYVWFDALTNYISCLGWPNSVSENYQKFWVEGETLQLAGKDQLRFQSVIWQAMLKSAGLPSTDTVFYHGFVNMGGQKMSKSLGNVISPYNLVDRYGVEATRYIISRHIHPTEDSDLTWEKMDEYYTANLVNGLGNLVARIMKMAETHLEKPVEIKKTTLETTEFFKTVAEFNFQGAADLIWKKIGVVDEFIAEAEPFKVIKTDQEKGLEMITKLVKDLGEIAELLQSFLPKTSAVILEAIKQNKKPENLFLRLE